MADCVRICELRQKEVINIRDGCRFGYIYDIEMDITEGKTRAIIIPGPARVLGVFGHDQEYKVPWDCIKQIGEDIILVDVDTSKVIINI